jgi:hypothetical protein
MQRPAEAKRGASRSAAAAVDKESRIGLTALMWGLRLLLLAALLPATAPTAPIRTSSEQFSLSTGEPILASDCSTSTANSASHEGCADPLHDCCLPVGEDADGVAARSAFAASLRTSDAEAPYSRRDHDLPRWRRTLAFSARAPPSFS